MTSLSAQAPSAPAAPRKWDAEITTARQQPAWLAFEAGIHQKATRGGPCGTHRARVARALDRYGLGTSDIAIDEALDYLINKELGQSRQLLQDFSGAHGGKIPNARPVAKPVFVE